MAVYHIKLSRFASKHKKGGSFPLFYVYRPFSRNAISSDLQSLDLAENFYAMARHIVLRLVLIHRHHTSHLLSKFDAKINIVTSRLNFNGFAKIKI